MFCTLFARKCSDQQDDAQPCRAANVRDIPERARTVSKQNVAMPPAESKIPDHFALLAHSSVRIVMPFCLEGATYSNARKQFHETKAPNGDWAWKPIHFDGKVIDHVDEFLNLKTELGKEIAIALRFAQMHALDLGHLVFSVGSRNIRFGVSNAELVLFQSGIGFCILELISTENSVSDLCDLAHYLRFIWSTRGPRRVEDIRREKGPLNNSLDVLALFEQLLSPIAGYWTSAGQQGQLRSYVVLLAESSDATPLEIGELTQRVRRIFHSRTTVHLGDGPDLYPRGLSYGENMMLHHSLDGGGFVGLNIPNDQFHRQTLPDHMGRAYFFGFVFALHQRILIEQFSLRVQNIDALLTTQANASTELRHANEVSREFRHALTRYFFRQTMQTQNHHTSYRRWLEVLEVESFVAEVRRELFDTYTYLDAMHKSNLEDLAEQRARNFERIGVVFAVVSIMAGFAGMNINGVNVSSDGFALKTVILFMLVPALVLVLGVVINLSRSRRSMRRNATGSALKASGHPPSSNHESNSFERQQL
jgi:hypothetical protein